TYDNKSSASQGAGASIAWSHPVGTGADRMLVVGIATESTANVTVTGVAFGVSSPQAFTQVTGARAVNGTSTYNATDLWYLVAPAETTDTITVTFSGSVTNGTVATAVSLFGVVQGAPEAVANFNAGAPPYSATLSTALTDGAWLVDILENSTQTGNYTPTSGQTEQWDIQTSYNHSAAGSTREVRATTPASTVKDTWTSTGTSRSALSVAAFAPVTSPAPAANMVAFGLPGSPATISGNAITWVLPYGTDLTKLKPTFTLSYGATCNKDNGGPAEYDFSGPVDYTVTAQGGSPETTYTVTASVNPTIILNGGFAGNTSNWTLAGGGVLYEDVQRSHDAIGRCVRLMDPNGTLKQTVTLYAGNYILSGWFTGGACTFQLRDSGNSPVTPSGSTSPALAAYPTWANWTREYTGLAAGTYTVYVLCNTGWVQADDFSMVPKTAPSTACDLVSFNWGSYVGTINQTAQTVSLVVPHFTDLTTLVPACSASLGAAISPASGVQQDFSDSVANPVQYTVTAEDGVTQKSYAVTVTNHATILLNGGFAGNTTNWSLAGNGILYEDVQVSHDAIGRCVRLMDPGGTLKQTVTLAAGNYSLSGWFVGGALTFELRDSGNNPVTPSGSTSPTFGSHPQYPAASDFVNWTRQYTGLAAGDYSVYVYCTTGWVHADDFSMTQTFSTFTTTEVITSGTPSNVGQNVTFTATILPQTGTDAPTGAVQFKVDGTNLGDPVGVTLGTGSSTAEAGTSTLSVVGSPHAVTADFTGSGNFTNSIGTLAGGQTVSPATTTTVASSLNPSTLGDPVTFTATIHPVSGVPPIPSGTVQFKVDGSDLGDPVDVTAGTSPDGTAVSINIDTLTVGALHAVTAVFTSTDGLDRSTGTLSGGQVLASAAVQTDSAGPGGSTVTQFTSSNGTATGQWVAPEGVTSINLLVVGGGGGGGFGGGGAGGLIHNAAYPVSPGTTYYLMVGAGGTAGSGTANGGPGTNSVFDTLTGYGGGGGQGSATAPAPGGSSGGTGNAATPAIAALVLDPMQGYGGGLFKIGVRNCGGGGGGATGIGGSNADGDVNLGTYPDARQDGGPGMDLSSVFGTIGVTAGVFAGGGGGGTGDWNFQAGYGGVGGGGYGGGGNESGPANIAGVANTGGGGGGDVQTAGAGGSGTVLISYGGTPSTSYTTWATANGASSDPAADSNSNGIPNGIEFFMGASPSNPATMPAVVNTAGTITWTIPYDPAAAATYMFQLSDDLSPGGWTDVVPPDASIVVLTSPDRIQFTLPSATRKFCRLMVTPTP
ncbi:MAG: DUF5018 domain-containing protein, partial [Verrucomicrobia bacterium]|nr:DUF5018 domain-containing protein [Verrucomicrobiota bacterium]